MDKATSGSIMIGENDIAKYNDKELTRYRANDVGFIFQFYNIMPTLTVDENVNLIKDVTNTSKNSKEVLKSVGLLKHADKFPQEDRKSTRLNSSHPTTSRMPSSA